MRHCSNIDPKTRLAIGVGLVGVVLAGCMPGQSTSSSAQPQSSQDSQQSTTSAPPSSPTTTTNSKTTQSQATTSRCHTSQLAGSLNEDQSAESVNNGAVANLVLRNTSQQTCTISGFPGLQLISGGDERKIPTNPMRQNPSDARAVTLRPGASATSLLQWNEQTDIQQDPDCTVPAVGQVSVIPPDETSALTLSWPQVAAAEQGQGQGQGQTVCNNGDIKVTAFHS